MAVVAVARVLTNQPLAPRQDRPATVDAAADHSDVLTREDLAEPGFGGGH